jgi:hypothetical protein
MYMYVHNLEKSMSYAFSVSHVGEQSGQNRCASETQNIESNTHGIMLIQSGEGKKFLPISSEFLTFK